tara:strand:+ start:34947 stop:36995 length:2049 start_codon:yes stop_codon:yes gene_type:complete
LFAERTSTLDTGAECPVPALDTVQDNNAGDRLSFASKRQAEQPLEKAEAEANEPPNAKRQFNKSAPAVFTATLGPTIEAEAPAVPDSSETASSRPSVDLPPLSDVESFEAFIKFARSAIGLRAADMDELSQSFGSLYRSIIAFCEDVVSNTKSMIGHENTIATLNEKIENLRARQVYLILVPGESSLSHRLEAEIVALEARRRTLLQQVKQSQDAAEVLRREFMAGFLDDLRTICKQRESTGKANHNNNLRLEILELETKSNAAMSVCKYRLEVIDGLTRELHLTEMKAAADLKEMRDSAHEKRVQLLIAHKEELRSQTERYAAQIDEANGKLRLYKEGVIKLEKSEKIIQKLEHEKSLLVLAKAAVEKELHDLTVQANQWKRVADGYDQIKMERDQILGQLNDVVAERDELRQVKYTVGEMPRTDGSSDISHTTPIHPTGTLKTDDGYLDGLQAYWEKQFELAEVSKRKILTEIAEVEEETAEIEQQLKQEQLDKGKVSEDAPTEHDPPSPTDDTSKAPSDSLAVDDSNISAQSPGSIHTTTASHPDTAAAQIPQWSNANFLPLDVGRVPLNQPDGAMNPELHQIRGLPYRNIPAPGVHQRSSSLDPRQEWPKVGQASAEQAHVRPSGAPHQLAGSRAGSQPQAPGQTYAQTVKVVQDSFGKGELWSTVRPKGKAPRKTKG